MPRIAHAIHDEKGGIEGLIQGDQGTEVVYQPYYAKNKAGVPWTHVFRAKDRDMAERIAQNMEQLVENNNIGYSQKHRSDWFRSALANGRDITKAKGDCDCSSGVNGCVYLAGGSVDPNLTTRSMVKPYRNSGQFDILTSAKYIQSSDYLRRGDILQRDGHTAVMVDDGKCPGAVEKEETEWPPKTKAHRIITDGVKKWCNVRSGPSTQDEIIGRAYLNDVFNAYAYVEDWYQIDYKGREGFIYKQYVSEVDE